MVHFKNLFAPKFLKVIFFYSNDKSVISAIVMQLVWFYMHDTIIVIHFLCLLYHAFVLKMDLKLNLTLKIIQNLNEVEFEANLLSRIVNIKT